MSRTVIDLTGQRFGKLVALSFKGRSATNITYWNTICDCGVQSVKDAHALRRGTTKSCGTCRGVATKPFSPPTFMNMTIDGYVVTYMRVEGSQRPVTAAE